MTTNNKRNFTPRDELQYKFIQSARLSPDGKWAVYALKQNNIEKESISTHLWLVELASGRQTQLTQGDHHNSAPEWSPDSQQIAYRSDRAGKTQIFLLPVGGGEASQFTHLKQGIGDGPVWSPDGTQIAFTAGSEEEPPDPTKPYRIKRFVYRFDGIGYLDRAVQNVFIQPLQGGEPKKLTAHQHIARSLHWSQDGMQILFMAAADPDRSELFSASICTVNLDGKIKEVLDLDWGWMLQCHLDGRWEEDPLFGVPAGKVMGSRADLWVLDPSTGKMDCRTAGLKGGGVYGFGPFLLQDEKHVLGGVLREGMGEIYRISLSGKESLEPVIQGKRDARLEDVGSVANLLYVSGSPENPGELAIASLDGRDERILTTHNTAWLEEIDLPKVKTLRYKNDEGIEIEGWIMLPPTGKAPFPTILYNHGGPHGGYGYSFRSDFQMLAGAGYTVLYLNPRGSAGYGDEISAALSGSWGVMDYKDLMAGVEYSIEKGWADPDQLGVCGLSYGGYLTCFIVGQTERFKAAVAENPITDLVSRYGTADMGPWGSLGEIGGKPHEIPEVYRRSSPVTYAHRCTTPTLLVQGENDYRCPAGQSEQFYTMLKANGCIAEMLRLPNMPHVGSINGPIPVQKAQNEALLDWMDRYLKGESRE